MTGKELRARREKLGMTQEVLSRKLEVSLSTIARFFDDDIPAAIAASYTPSPSPTAKNKSASDTLFLQPS